MKLLLTSDGLNEQATIDFFARQFDGLEGKKACVVATLRLPEYQVYIDAARKELEDLGIAADVVNISEDIDALILPEYDVYYSCGGNTFHILERMRKTGMDKVLVRAIKDGRFYIGVSAGSILVGPDIGIAGWGEDGDPNDIGLRDLSSFGAVPYLIFPHYTESNRQEVLEFKSKRNSEPVIGLTDGQALFVTDDKAILIGEKGGLLLCDGFIVEDKTLL
jgi:dipeptidase E